MDKIEYEKQLKKLQGKLTLLQHAYSRSGRQAMIVLEGYDAAGKGGLIRRLVWALDPRPLRVHSIGAPSASEMTEHWLKRFWTKVPSQGRWAVFDRSWYGRVLVERIEELASKDEWSRAYEEINAFERTLSLDGVRIIKLLLEISPKAQLERFEDRYHDPKKRWKLTLEDLRNRDRFGDYHKAYKEMVERTHSDDAPWIRIDANDKREARLAGLNAILTHLSVGVNVSPPAALPEIAAFFDKGKS